MISCVPRPVRSPSLLIRYLPATMDAPPIQYARTGDGVNIAYWTTGTHVESKES
jgi:hypothetical protein